MGSYPSRETSNLYTHTIHTDLPLSADYTTTIEQHKAQLTQLINATKDTLAILDKHSKIVSLPDSHRTLSEKQKQLILYSGQLLQVYQTLQKSLERLPVLYPPVQATLVEEMKYSQADYLMEAFFSLAHTSMWSDSCTGNQKTRYQSLQNILQEYYPLLTSTRNILKTIESLTDLKTLHFTNDEQNTIQRVKKSLEVLLMHARIGFRAA